jgi:uncharacterized protein
MRLRTPLMVLLLCLAPHAGAQQVDWRPLSADLFEQASSRQRFVFLYLEAVWCHWCHVMQRETLANPEVATALGRRWIATRVDHDANPLLANRYRDYGWPALIFFAPDGTELVKRAGYLAPQAFLDLLAAIEADPTPEAAGALRGGAQQTQAQALSAAERALLEEKFRATDDPRRAGLRTPQKFLDRDTVEYALLHEPAIAVRTLDAAQRLLDPVWGGVYQYSTGSDWNRPHYEKLMRTQAGYLRIYARAHAQLGRATDLNVAQRIRDYMLDFLQAPNGAFHPSQDADLVRGSKADDYFALDDAQRRRRGMPRVDPALYADASGLAAEALATLYEVSGDEQALTAARQAAQWLISQRRLPDGRYRHGERDREGRYLGDTLHAARAFLQLYRVTAERHWLAQAQASADALARHFRAADAGLLTATGAIGPLQPLPVVEENIYAARLLNLLAHYGGRAADRELALHALRFLVQPALVRDAYTEPGILLADAELASDPAHFTIVGPRHDAQAAALHAVALRAPGSYKRVEWWDRAEGPLPHADIEYPRLARPAAYVCAAGRCSLPSFTPEAYAQAIARLR